MRELTYFVRYISYETLGFLYFSFTLCIISVLMMQSERKDLCVTIDPLLSLFLDLQILAIDLPMLESNDPCSELASKENPVSIWDS